MSVPPHETIEYGIFLSGGTVPVATYTTYELARLRLPWFPAGAHIFQRTVRTYPWAALASLPR